LKERRARALLRSAVFGDAAAGSESAAALGRATLVADALLFVPAFLVRLAFGLFYASEAVWDGHYYDYYAKRIAEGHGYTDALIASGIDVGHASCHYPVGYSAFLGGFYAVFGSAQPSAVFFNALVGAGLVVLVRRLAAHSLSRGRAFFAGALAAFHPGLIAYAALTMSEPLAALLTLAAFVVALEARVMRYTSKPRWAFGFRHLRVFLGSRRWCGRRRCSVLRWLPWYSRDRCFDCRRPRVCSLAEAPILNLAR
jgi:dolichyl-phosphate-mannose--protein O-mannosyl transferase